MRNWITLTEKWAKTLPKTISGGTADIHVNPTKIEMGKLMREWQDRVCRATMSRAGDLYVWHTDAAFHEEVQEQMGVEMLPVSLFCYWPDRSVEWGELPYWRDEHTGVYDDELAEYGHIILNSPALKRLYGGYQVWGEDEDGQFSIAITPEWLANPSSEAGDRP